jgi:hypothetical protein
VGHVAYIGKIRNACRILVQKPERKKVLGGAEESVRILLKWVVGK